MTAMNHDKALSQDEIHELFDIDAEAGLVRWRKRGPGRCMTKPVGCLLPNGRRKIGLRQDGQPYIQYYAHHIIWAHHHGKWPPMEIDHINGEPDDNRISNLRLATHRRNAVNRRTPRTNKLGLKWVCEHKNSVESGRTKIFQAAVWFGKDRRQKYFADKFEAHEWAKSQARELHGEFYNPGG